jgi:hypothetical protein
VKVMMGERQVDQGALFYEFSLEKQVPTDHMLRSIDRCVDLGPVRTHLASFYSSTGRPSIDPELLVRMLPRSIHEGARDLARAIAQTDAYCSSRRQRKKVEMLFAHLKRILRLDRLRLRGPCGARDEFLLAATAQNLRKLAKLITPPTPMPAT